MCERFKLFPFWFSFLLGWSDCIEVIAVKCLLSITVSQNHLVLFYILNFCVFWYTFFVIWIVFFYGLDRVWGTSGRNGGNILLFSSLFQSILLKKGWYFTSSMPFVPSLFSGFRWINRFTKSTLSRLHPYGGISSSWICLAKIFYLISFLFAPIYGR